MKETNSLITEPLGLYGWKQLEPVILAVLATESPLLLVGKHGCAKSFILERLAETLKLNYRFYNASLINYDDLVGIPVPVKNNTQLDYISHPNSIWDAEILFVDELNRTKVELQNKLFPLIYDKRIQGIDLHKLKYRWAAMNPPVSDDEEFEDDSYIGTSNIDPALADRFTYVVEVPSYSELTDEEKEKMLLDSFEGRHEFQIDIKLLIEETKKELERQIKENKEKTSNYILSLIPQLQKYIGYVSLRRASLMNHALLALHSSRIVLSRFAGSEVQIDYTDTAYLHILSTIPNLANKKLDKATLCSIVASSLKLASLSPSPEKELLLINSPLEKLKYAIKNRKEITASVLDEIIPSTISKLNPFEKKVMSLISFLTFREIKDISAAIIETLLIEIRDLFSEETIERKDILKRKNIYNRIVSILCGEDKSSTHYNYMNNLLYSFYPKGYRNEDDVEILANAFKSLWKELINE